MEIYNKLSIKYDQLYGQNMLSFKDNMRHSWNGDGWFVDFYPSLGIKSGAKCDLLFYGQAVNGWKSGFNVYEERGDVDISSSIWASNAFFGKLDHSPLDWVNVAWSNAAFESVTKGEDAKLFYQDLTTYRAHRSFFWKVIWKLTSDYYELGRESGEWAKKTVWSNLYKITEDGRNPSKYLREKQLDVSSELIKLEIEELQPKYCVVLTNTEWWRPFSNKIGTKNVSFDASLDTIKSVEQYAETKIIVTTRPRFGSGETHVAQILKLIGRER
jgi:hypothetical protein